MPTSSIGSGKDYSTIQAWEDAQSVLSGVHTGELYDDVYDENVVISGQTSVSASNYLHLKAHSTTDHYGTFGAGATIDPIPAKYGHVFQLETDYCEFSGFTITGWQGTSSEAFRVNADECRFERLMVHNAHDTNADGMYLTLDSSTTYVSNCFFYMLGRTAVHIATGSNKVAYVYGCTGLYLCCNTISVQPDAEKSYCGFGFYAFPGLTSCTMHVKDTYSHTLETWEGRQPCFRLSDTGSDWGNSTNNGADDSTAPGTSPQNAAVIENQIIQELSYANASGETGVDYDCPTEDTYINGAAATTNYGSNASLQLDDSEPKHILIRMDLSNVPDDKDTFRLQYASMSLKTNVSSSDSAGIEMFEMKRNWTEGGVTYNKYDGTNDWGTAGAQNNSDRQPSMTGGTGGSVGIGFLFAEYWGGANVWHDASSCLFTEMCERAIDGEGNADKGVDWIDFMIQVTNDTTPVWSFDADSSADGEPELQLYYDTAATPLDARPIAGGVLDGNGTNLSSDGDYPISIDIAGVTRDSTWDIGAFRFAEDTDVRATQIVAEILRSGGEDIRATQIVAEILRSGGESIRATQILSEVLYAPALGQDELGAAAVLLALATNTPLPALTIERTAAVDLVADPITATWIREIKRFGSAGLQSITGSDIYKSRDTLSDFTDNEGTWTDQGSGVYRCTAIGTGNNTLLWNHFIPMDREIVGLEWGMEARLISGTAPTIYIGLKEHVNSDPIFGAGELAISPQFVNIFTSTETTLAADININDTTCTVASAAGWEDSTNYFALLYNIENDQSDVPNPNYLWMNRAASPISGNVITFHDPSPVFVASGTKVRQSRSGGTDQYAYFPSGYLTGSFQGVYNWISEPFEDIQAYSTTWAADGDNKMFSGFGGGVGRSDGGFRPGTDLFNFRVFTIGNDATTIVEVRWIYIKTLWESTALVDHSAIGTETLALTTAATPDLTFGAIGSLALAITEAGAGSLDIARLANVDLTATVPASGGQPVMFLYPSSDITITNFEDELGGTTDIFNSLNEGEPGSGADYVQTTSGVGGTYECGLTAKGDPEASDYHYVLYGYQKAPVGNQVNLTVSLMEGAIQRAQWVHTNIGSTETQAQQLLSGAEADSLTAYNDLRLRFVVTVV